MVIVGDDVALLDPKDPETGMKTKGLEIDTRRTDTNTHLFRKIRKKSGKILRKLNENTFYAKFNHLVERFVGNWFCK